MLDMQHLSALTSLGLGADTSRNRLGLAPISSGLINSLGFPTEDFKEFHSLYANQNIGTVFLGGVAVSPPGRASSRSLVLDSGAKAEALKPTVECIRSAGALPILQLMHAGRQGDSEETHAELVAASPYPCPVVGVRPRELTKAGIQTIVSEFALAAALAAHSGVKLIELHAAHGYLLSGFLSTELNFRTDEYGGTLYNRFRIVHQIAESIKSVPVEYGIRISADAFMDSSINRAELPALCKLIEHSGATYISVSAGVYSAEDRIMPDRALGEAIYRQLAHATKSEVTIPVMLAGNITSLDSACELVSSGDADMILFGRALLSDPYLVHKSLIGYAQSVVPCSMNQLCKYHSRRLPHVVCPHNDVLKAMLKRTLAAADEGDGPIMC
jgi:2,4-dienoyl-CoA reductase-like NADH-dependent reductase (Old Yellow Enzyme family)